MQVATRSKVFQNQIGKGCIGGFHVTNLLEIPFGPGEAEWAKIDRRDTYICGGVSADDNACDDPGDKLAPAGGLADRFAHCQLRRAKIDQVETPDVHCAVVK